MALRVGAARAAAPVHHDRPRIGADDPGSLTYRPRISGHWAARYPGSPITDYGIYVSADGKHFEKVASGTWRNSLAATKVANFSDDYDARYIRLKATGGIREGDPSVTAGEINGFQHADRGLNDNVREPGVNFSADQPA